MRPLGEKLRYILKFGKLLREGEEWVFTSAPDVDYIQIRDKSKWEIVQTIYFLLKGND